MKFEPAGIIWSDQQDEAALPFVILRVEERNVWILSLTKNTTFEMDLRQLSDLLDGHDKRLRYEAPR